MSGHSKWATIRHKKGALDAKRGKIFTKLIKEITVAARIGGGDLDANASLRSAILKAKASNMPKDNIERAIKKGTGDVDGANYVELTYEAYGQGGVAILIDTLTDNRNRTASDVRSIVTKAGGNLGESGCVSYLFKRKGLISYDASKYSEDKVLDLALEAGADDVTNDGETIEVVTEPDSFETVLNAMTAAGMTHSMAEVVKVAETKIMVDKETAEKVINLIEKLEDNDDVQSVATNMEVPDDFEG
jgi:YebC/PmpR family DNA-binding regulatory protein